jgi:hypothetical protein
MTKALFILLLSSLSTDCLAQNLDRLDATNGFRKFKFGMLKSQFAHLSDHQTSIHQRDVTICDYNGHDITEFTGIKIEAILLGFYKNRLYQINISFGSPLKEYASSEFKIVQSGLEMNFGHSFHKCNEDPSSDIINCAIWDGTAVRVENLRINLSERDGTRNRQFNYIQGYILFTEKIIQQEQQRSEIEN